MFTFNDLGSIIDIRKGTVWTADEFRRQVARRVEALRALHVSRHDRVVIAYGGQPEFFADLFAAWWLGACCACVNPDLTEAEFETVIAFVKPRALLVSRDSPARVVQTGVLLVDTAVEPDTAADLPATTALGADDPALILFTSGTTGNPKGVVHTGGTLAARLALNRRRLGAPVLARTLCILPTHFGHGLIGNCLTPLANGYQLYLFPTPSMREIATLGALLQEQGITFMSSVPTFWKIALKVARPPSATSLRQVSIGSAPLSAALWRSVIDWTGIDNVCNMYGITEGANWVAGASASRFTPQDGLVGTMWGGEASVLAADGQHYHEGKGEILLRTPSVMAGYFRRDDLTAQAMHEGWYRTGDYGSIDHDGVIRLTGRIKTEINRAGSKVLPEEIDLLLERHPDVLEACTFGIPDPVNGEMVAVAVQLANGDTTAVLLRQWCRAHIRPDCVPEKWFLVPEIPKTDRGKVNRNQVRDACLEGDP